MSQFQKQQEWVNPFRKLNNKKKVISDNFEFRL